MEASEPDVMRSAFKRMVVPERCCGEGGGRGVHVWECM